MEQEASVHLTEEEKYGWTIVNSMDNEKSGSSEELTEAEHEEADKNLGSGVVAEKEEDDKRPADAGGGADHQEDVQKREYPKEGKVSEDVEEDDLSYHGDGDDEKEDEVKEGAVSYDDEDGEQDFLHSKAALGTDDAIKDFPWELHRDVQEGTPLVGNQHILAHQQVHKHGGLLWRVSLVATLGFIGWFVITGLRGGVGKNFRCLKFHSCDIKAGEAILNHR